MQKIINIEERYERCNFSFIYKLINIKLSANEFKAINKKVNFLKIKEYCDRKRYLSDSLIFVRKENTIFSNNLMLIDCMLNEVCAEFVKLAYLIMLENVIDIVRQLEINNPVKTTNSICQFFYTYKIKKLLSAIALGMISDQVWTGQHDALASNFVFKHGGVVLPHHILNEGDFENYLLNNTRVEANPIKGNLISVYEEDGQQYFKLNLQIRFIK